MKIFVVCQFYYPENFTISKVCEQFVKFGHEVHVLTGKPNYGFGHLLAEYNDINEEIIEGVNVHRVNVYPRKLNKLSIIKNYLSFWWNGRKWVKKTKLKADVVFSMSLSPVTILAPANKYKKKFHVKHVCHCVDLWPESVAITNSISRKSFLFHFLFKWSKSLYSQVDKMIIGSPSFKDYFQNVLHLKNIDLTYIPQTSLLSEELVLKSRFDQYFDVVYCGNIGTIQKVEDIPYIMTLVKNESVRFHIIGMGTNTNLLLENIKKYNISDKVIYHGPLPFKKACPYLFGSDVIYVSLTSKGYVGKTIPNKLVMSMGLSRPIIGNMSGDGKTVSKEAGGVYVCQDDFQEIASCIDELSKKHKTILDSMGEANKNYYDKHFSLEVVSRKIESILLEIFNKGI